MNFNKLSLLISFVLLTACGPAEEIADETVPTEEQTGGLEDGLVVCDTCSPELLAAKIIGIRRAMKMLVGYAGTDVLPKYAPVTFHLQGGEFCGDGSRVRAVAVIGRDNKAYACLFDVEHAARGDRGLPFTPEESVKLQDQETPVHEAVHILFMGRMNNYKTEEAFAQFISFLLTGGTFRPSVCENSWSETSQPIFAELCKLDFRPTYQVPEIMRATALKAEKVGRPLTVKEFAEIVGEILGADAVPAFQNAGLLP